MTTHSLPTGLRLFDGAYELEGVLGQGGFGITYLAKHPMTGAKVAVKELFPEHLVRRDSSGNLHAKAGMQSEFEGLKSRFDREAKTLRELKHHSSTRFIETWEELGTAFIAMEFVDGETLELRIERGILLDEYSATKVMIPILYLLQEVHNKGILHRDIKPANIILTKDGGVELIDFGSVTKFSATQRIKITSRLLTPAYAPLEQYGQEVMLTPSTDLYALAATIYEAMTGVAPVPALERANGVKLESLQNLAPHVTPAFSKILMKALELRVEDRFLNASTLSLELQKKTLQINRKTALHNQTSYPPTNNSKTDRFVKEFIQKLLIVVITVPLCLILLPQLLPKNKVSETTFINPFPMIQSTKMNPNKPPDTCETLIKELDHTDGDFSRITNILARAKKLNCLPKGF